MSTVTDHIKKTKTITHYDYDAFGRRTLVQDEGGKIIRTLYDGLSFDIIREQETFADGYFTNTRDTGIQWGKVSEGDGSRYRYISDDDPVTQTPDGYQLIANNRASSSVALYANGKAISQTRSSNNASTERTYFGTDLLGTVRSATRDSGSAEYYNYDVFGKPLGDNISDFAYTGKPYDPTTGMYNYGYRDYVPQTARFSTVDPIRDGNNWYAYCSNDPVNFVDLWGLEPVTMSTVTVGALFLTAGITVIAINNIIHNEKVTEGMKEFVNTVVDTGKAIINSAFDNTKMPKGNKVPKDNQPVEPTGKGASGGPENIPDPSQFGEPGNIPPDYSNFGKTILILYGAAKLYEDFFLDNGNASIELFEPTDNFKRDPKEPLDMYAYKTKAQKND